MKTLEELREELNSIDNDLLTLLKRRFEVTNEVGYYKKENSIAVFAPAREQEILESLAIKAKDYQIREALIIEIYKLVFEESRNLQEKIVNS
jgi:monofunctional chorismate mutase